MEDLQHLDDVSVANNGAQPVGSAGPSNVDPPEVPESEKNAVKEWTTRIQDAKKHWEKRFKRMRACQQIAAEGADKEWSQDNYTVPILMRHINVSVAALYARNPTATAKRKKKVQFKLWDGNFASLQQAMTAAAGNPGSPPMPPSPENPQGSPGSPPVPPDPNAVALLQEVQAVHQQNVLMDRAGQTLEILFDYFMNEQDAGYKQQLKASVRRTKVCGVSWVDLDFQRLMTLSPDRTAQIADVTSKIATLSRLLQDAQAGEFDEQSAEMDELKHLVEDLQTQPDMIVREGPVLGFPKADAVIVDPHCVHLKTLAGAEWLAQEYPPMSRDAIKEIFGVDIGTNFAAYVDKDKKDEKEKLAVVWKVQNKKTQENFTICEGYPAYLKPPAAPNAKISRFWTLFPLVFNEVESDDDIYPNSDVWTARHMQREYNTIRQSLREHRIQNKPKYGTVKGKLDEGDKTKLATAESGAVIELNSLNQGEKVGDILQQIETIPIDPNLYEVNTCFNDIERTIGSSQPDLGAPASTTATQSSIIEQGRSTTNSDNVDDLDDLLTEVARAMGELMLLELDNETVVRIAGDGAVWPQSPPTRQQIAEDLWLEVKAGSSGRPNRAAELANMERGLPYLIQIPGVNPYPLGRRYGDLLDLDVDDIVIEGMPSIAAQNAAAGRDPFSNKSSGGTPEAMAGQGQGNAGSLNAPGSQPNEPGPQPAYPAGASGLEAPGVLGTSTAPIPAPRYQAQKIAIGPPKVGA